METPSRESQPAAPGMGREFRNLQEHGSATVDELRDFLVRMRGKSARQMLGALAESGLVRATMQATVAAVALLAVMTAGPYMLGVGNPHGQSGAAAARAKTQAGTTKPAADSHDSNESLTDSSAERAGGGGAQGGGNATSLAQPDLDKAAKKMGIGETKSADPQVNPLDKSLDSLLDKVK